MLREVTHDDEPFLARQRARPEVQTRIGLGVTTPPSSCIRLIERGGERAGVVGLVPTTAFKEPGMELFCVVDTAHEGNHVATDACKALLADYRASSPATRLFASAAPDNLVGQHLAQVLGFQRLDYNRSSLASDEFSADPAFKLPRSC